MAFTAAVTALAASNALLVPLVLERQILSHASTPLALGAGSEAAAWPNTTAAAGQAPAHPWLAARLAAYTAAPKACPDPARLRHNALKHREEIGKMLDPEHQALTPLVEAALAVMRLSCEKYFVLLSVFVAYLLFKDMPRGALHVVRLNARLSSAFQKVILYSFPAVCWGYGAGFIFSTFVTVVFWGSPALALYEAARAATSLVLIRSLRPAGEADIERMGGNCAICWGEMAVPPAGADAGALPAAPPPEGAPVSPDAWVLGCGHAYHHACLLTWLHQCHSQGMAATCPMCQGEIQVQVKWRVPGMGRAGGRGGRQQEQQQQQQQEEAGAQGGAEGQGQGQGGRQLMLPHQQELMELLRDMPAMLRAQRHELAQAGPHEEQPLLGWRGGAAEAHGAGDGALAPGWHWPQQAPVGNAAGPGDAAQEQLEARGEQLEQLQEGGGQQEQRHQEPEANGEQQQQHQQGAMPGNSSSSRPGLQGRSPSPAPLHGACPPCPGTPGCSSGAQQEPAAAAVGRGSHRSQAGPREAGTAAAPCSSAQAGGSAPGAGGGSSSAACAAEAAAASGLEGPLQRQQQFRSEVNRVLGDLEAFRARHAQLLDKGSSTQVDGAAAAAAAASLGSQP
jgi:hypothetical protein